MTIISLERLQKWCCFDRECWRGIGDHPISRQEVEQAIQEGRLRPRVVPLCINRPKPADIRKKHIERIAYLVVNLDPRPIDIDVGVPCMGAAVEWIVQDGNHRLGAAFYRGDLTIEAGISGQVDYAEHLLGVNLKGTVPVVAP